MYSILPGVLALANGIILIWYPLTEDMVKTVERDLADRRKDDEA